MNTLMYAMRYRATEAYMSEDQMLLSGRRNIIRRSIDRSEPLGIDSESKLHFDQLDLKYVVQYINSFKVKLTETLNCLDILANTTPKDNLKSN